MALKFITTTDLETNIRPQFLTAITDDNQDIQDKAEASAISKMGSYLRTRFDTDAIFSTGEDAVEYQDRELIMEMVCHLFLYRLYRRINPRNVPDDVRTDYDECITWLEGVANNNIHPQLPPLEGEDERRTDQVSWGGINRPSNNDY